MNDISQASEAPEIIERDVGDVVDGRYRIVRRVGEGGMGAVFEVQHTTLKARQAALKVLKPAYAKDMTFALRFEREANAASSIEHPNVVKIYDFGHLPTGELYYTMELLQGQDLAQLLRENKGGLPWSRAGWIILQIVSAFTAIHEKKIVHRDLKPANCFLLTPKAGDEPDFVKILDFGIANLDEDSKAAALTGANDVLGTMFYMAPEQWASEQVDARTDIYALGIMMYELLTGDVPFRGTNAGQIMRGHLQKAPRHPRELKPDIPPEVADLIMCALSKSPKKRPQSMAEIEAALTPLVDIPDAIEGSRTAPRGSSSIRFRDTYAIQRQQRRLGMVVAVVVAFVVALAVTRWMKKAAEDDREAVAEVGPLPGTLTNTEEKPDPEPEWLLLLPEKQHNPFADPFGHASLRGLMVPSPDGSGTLVPLESLLPPEPWSLEPGRVAGRILNDRQRPLAGAGVCLWSIDPEAPAEYRRRPFCTETDRKGNFELPEVNPGYYDVNVFARGFLPQSYFEGSGYPLTVQPKGSIEGIEMALVAGGVEVRGVVKSKLGDRLSAAKVAVVGPIRTLAVTNEAGEFSLWVAEGELSLVAWAQGYANVVEGGTTEQKFSFALSRESILVGKVIEVIDENTHVPIQGARVRATSRTMGIDPLVYTNSKGEFRIPGLPPGEYEPSARTDDGYGPTRKTDDAYRMAHKVIKVGEGVQSSEIEIALLRTKKVGIVEKEDDPPPTTNADLRPGGWAGATVAGGSESPAAGGSGAPVAGGPGLPVAGEPESPVAGGSGAPIAGGPESPVAGEPESPVAGGPESPVVLPATGDPGAMPKGRHGNPRKKLENALKSCGSGMKGTIRVESVGVYADGKLMDPEIDVDVTGEADEVDKVNKCVEERVRNAEIPSNDGELSARPVSIVVKL